MLDSSEKPNVVNLVRSMRRIGFSYEELYDGLTGAGISSMEAQLLLERIEEDFEDTNIESQSTRLGREVERVFDEKLKETKVEIKSKLRKFEMKIEKISDMIDDMEKRISELQGIRIKEFKEMEVEKDKES